MAIAELGEELLVLCMSKEDKLAEVPGLLESLNDEDQRLEVVRHMDEVSKS